MKNTARRAALAVSLAAAAFALTASCTARSSGSSSAPTAGDAKQFLGRVNDDLMRLSVANAQTGWVAQNFITDDTEAVDARAPQAAADATARYAKEATRFDSVDVAADQRRQLTVLKNSLVLATPTDPKEAEEVT